MEQQYIFISSSADLKESRDFIRNELERWLRDRGLDDMLAPFLWEDDLEDKPLQYSDRIPVQESLPDPAYSSVLMTVCMFGERCGVPLQDDLLPHWDRRVDEWRACDGEAGVLHPWPKDLKSERQELAKGNFPLTGTVFELLSAYTSSSDIDQSDLVIGYVASKPVTNHLTKMQIDFGGKNLWNRLTKNTTSRDERDQICEDIYDPQIEALLNLIKFINNRYGVKGYFQSAEAMQEEVLAQLKKKLTKRLYRTSPNNPFKLELTHWGIDEEHELPGREDQKKKLLSTIANDSTNFVLLKGRSGCGKSSLLQCGLLSKLRDQGDLILAVRPTEVEPVNDSEEQLDILFHRMAEILGLVVSHSEMANIARRKKCEYFSERIIKHLANTNQNLILALDQFEEIIDDLGRTATNKNHLSGWQQVLSFLKCLSNTDHFTLVGTLESSRYESFENLNIEKIIGLTAKVIDVDVNENDIEEIAVEGFRKAGITLSDDLLEKIKRKWNEFQDANLENLSASPLPLACLWLANLFEKFEDRATVELVERGNSTTNSTGFNRENAVIKLSDLEEEVDFSLTIHNLAEQAWYSAGESVLYAKYLESNKEGLNSLNNFLTPYVALHVDGHKTLLSSPVSSYKSKIVDSFLRNRLLVRANDTNQTSGDAAFRYKLVHQAVLDHWSVARAWFEYKQDYLRDEGWLRTEAKKWAKNKNSPVKKSRESIHVAASVLQSYHWHMDSKEELNDDDLLLRQYAERVFLNASTPQAVVKSSIYKKKFIHIAAEYHLVDLLDRFFSKSKAVIGVKSGRGDTILHDASWSDGPATPWILERLESIDDIYSDDGWHPIQNAIQEHANQNYRAMIDRISDINMVVAPGMRNMLSRAAHSGNQYVIEDLIDRETDTSYLDEHKRTALHHASWGGSVECFDRLIRFIDPNCLDTKLRNPIHIAASQGHSQIVKSFLNSSVSTSVFNSVLRQRDKEGDTPIMIAAKKGMHEIVRLLLSDCNARSKAHTSHSNQTLLHLSVFDQFPNDEQKLNARKTVQVLLVNENGPVLTSRDNNGKTVFDLAERYKEVRRVLWRDDRMPTKYEDMTSSMRVEILKSTDSNIIMRLLRQSPIALVDSHVVKHISKEPVTKTGLDILIEKKNYIVISKCLIEGIIDNSLLNSSFQDIVSLACETKASSVRKELTDRIDDLQSDDTVQAMLLDRFLRDEDYEYAEKLIKRGVDRLIGQGDMSYSIFHSHAIQGKVEIFKKTAQKYRFVLPLDSWGRKPSDLSSVIDLDQFRELESEFFSPSVEK
ncbi:ankyrin repeat domain-containing protein [bacterium SCSIO 12696]|nr:ankyrin repeat domain-containing protein [bacterium SCSIO 12696]